MTQSERRWPPKPLTDADLQATVDLVARLGGNKRQAAADLGTQRSTLRQRIIKAGKRGIKARVRVPASSAPDPEAGALSGGNLQKFIIGRELLQNPGVVIAAQPTWGLDVGAAQFIRQSLLKLRDDGVAVLVISEDLDELLEMCDRIAVIAAGRLSDARPVSEVSLEELGRLMSGTENDTSHDISHNVERN